MRNIIRERRHQFYMQITVTGVRSMGHSIAQVSAMAGRVLRLNDVSEERIEQGIGEEVGA